MGRGCGLCAWNAGTAVFPLEPALSPLEIELTAFLISLQTVTDHGAVGGKAVWQQGKADFPESSMMRFMGSRLVTVEELERMPPSEREGVFERNIVWDLGNAPSELVERARQRLLERIG